MIALLGLQKYFIPALLVLLAVASATALTYRANYIVENQQRLAVEESLKRTVEAFDQYTKTSKANLAAATRATAVARAMSDDRRSQREQVLRAPSEEDGPVAPVLRNALRPSKQP